MGRRAASGGRYRRPFPDLWCLGHVAVGVEGMCYRVWRFTLTRDATGVKAAWARRSTSFFASGRGAGEASLQGLLNPQQAGPFVRFGSTMSAFSLRKLAALSLAALGVGCTRAEPASTEAGGGEVEAMVTEPLQPAGPRPVFDEAKVELGRRLFQEPRLSRDGTIACANCHAADKGGADGRAFSVGVAGRVGVANAPSVFNAKFNLRNFWDGRADSLEAQIDGPLEAIDEMASSWPEALAKLRALPEYAAAFRAVYPEGGVSRPNVADAIATYERSLYGAPARFDRYLLGDRNALDAEEREGYALFKSYGCVSCHQGAGVGGNMFQTFGVMADYFADRGGGRKADLGRFNVTGDERDRHVFKVPSLRECADTAPYFHDGSAARLEDAIEIMAKYQLGRSLPPTDVAKIVAFLRTLSSGRPGAAR